MDDSPQSIYADCLSKRDKGYPLWFPEPSTSLPSSYLQDGLQIGDVGVINRKGSFDVLLNITYGPQHALHTHHDRTIFDKFPLVPNGSVAIDVRPVDPLDCVIVSSGITSQYLPQSDTYKFEASCAKGAILVLPQGAICHDLRYKKAFRTIAMERALEWYEIAGNLYGEQMSTCSLYLITGFHKASSWCLASFHDPASPALGNHRCLEIVPQRQEGARDGSTIGRRWVNTFPTNHRIGPRSNHDGNVNQTVYIRGFKIAVGDAVRDLLQVVITSIRAENVAAGLRRMPIGFCMLVEFDGIQRKTRNKQVSISDQLIEWDDFIWLPLELSAKVRLSVCASFEFAPMLGRGEVLHTLEKSVEEWVDNTQRLIMLGESDDTSCSSLLITTERRNPDRRKVLTYDSDTDLDWEVSPELAELTDLGHDALLSHHNELTQGNLDIAIQHFERAREICPSHHQCRVAVLRNLAMAKFLERRISGTYASLDAAISLYREALDLCHVDDPDRPATLLYLAHAFLYRYDKQGCEESVAAEVERLIAEIQDTCSLGSHEYRAAELVLQTCRRCRVINSSSPVGLDELISELDLAAQAPPLDYFDRPQRMHNLALLLLRRFELRGGLNDLNKSIAVHEEAIRLAPVSHPDRPMMLSRLGVSYFRRYLANLERSSSTTSEATFQWSSQSHIDWPWSWVLTNRNALSPSRLKQVGDLGDLGKSIDGMEEALQFTPAGHPDRRGILMDLSRAYLWRFGQVDDLGDLEKLITIMEEVLRSTQSSHPDWPGILMSLGHAYFWRTKHIGCARTGGINLEHRKI